MGRWRNRFIEKGFQGIEKELPRGTNHGGKDSLKQAKLRAKVIEMATQEKPEDGTRWSTRSLAKVLNINHSFVHRVWRESGLKPHLVSPFKVSNDPDIESKLRDVVGYMNGVFGCCTMGICAPRPECGHVRTFLRKR